MDYPEVSDSPLVWSWVIEALASSRDVELDLLCDLIDTTPKLSDTLSEVARQMLALRNLEALFDPVDVLNSGVSSDQEEIQFDSSECCSHVLRRVLDQTLVSSLRQDGSDPLENLRKGSSDKLMRDVHVFVERRKASMPKCALQELRDILQNGDACHETDLKRENNCLQTKKRMQDCPIDVQSGESPPGKKLRHNSNGSIASTEQNPASVISSDMQDCPVDVQSCKSPPGKKLSHDSNGSIASTEQNSAPGISSDMQDCRVDGQSGKSPLGKKCGHDSNGSSASKEKNSDPLTSSDINRPYPLSQNPAQPIGLLTWYPCHVLSKDEKRNAENSSTSADSTELHVCIKCNEGGEVLICSVSSCAVVVHEGCLGFSESIDNRDEFLCPFCVCASAKSEYAVAKEKMLLAREKLSLFVVGKSDHQSKGFKNVNANPPRQGVDKRTLKGKGVSQVGRASTDKQREGHLARDNVHISPPNCSSTGGEDITVKSSQLERGFLVVNENPPGQGGDERTLKGKGVYRVEGTSTDKQYEDYLARDNVHTSPSNCSSKGEDIVAKNCQLEKGSTNVNANPPRQGRDEVPSKGKGVHQAHLASADKQRKCHLVRDYVNTSPPKCTSNEGEDITAKICHPKKGKQMMPIELFNYAGVHGGHYELRPRQQLDSPLKNASCASSAKLHGGHYELRPRQQLDSPSKKASCASTAKLKGISETKNHTANLSDNLNPQSRRKLADQAQGASSASLDDCDGISEEENCRAASSKSSQKFKGLHSLGYLDRRIRVPWTEEEVEMLKEGMKRFGSQDMKVIPWTTILEFGSKVFWKGRTGGHLKDKWRNLLKANPGPR